MTVETFFVLAKVLIKKPGWQKTGFLGGELALSRFPIASRCKPQQKTLPTKGGLFYLEKSRQSQYFYPFFSDFFLVASNTPPTAIKANIEEGSGVETTTPLIETS